MDLYLTKDNLSEPNIIENDIPVLLDFNIDIMESTFKAVGMIKDDEDQSFLSPDLLTT